MELIKNIITENILPSLKLDQYFIVNVKHSISMMKDYLIENNAVGKHRIKSDQVHRYFSKYKVLSDEEPFVTVYILKSLNNLD